MRDRQAGGGESDSPVGLGLAERDFGIILSITQQWGAASFSDRKTEQVEWGEWGELAGRPAGASGSRLGIARWSDGCDQVHAYASIELGGTCRAELEMIPRSKSSANGQPAEEGHQTKKNALKVSGSVGMSI